MYRVWYSTESFADYIIDHTLLTREKDNLIKSKLYESDANNPKKFYTIPDHIRKILYLDAVDLIVEKDNEPVFAIEVTTEAGTGHNVFQRFARIAAAVENGVPVIYIYPEAVIVKRKDSSSRWDCINPLIFKALESIMWIYKIPALLYYFPSDYRETKSDPEHSHLIAQKGLRFDKNIDYAGCPDSEAPNMKHLFKVIDEVLQTTRSSVLEGRKGLLGKLPIREQIDFMRNEFSRKAPDDKADSMAPLTATQMIPTEVLLDYLSQYEGKSYHIGELLRGRDETLLYQVNAAFRGDPYAGALSAIDYLRCREGKTFEDRRRNLVLIFGRVNLDERDQTLRIENENGSSIHDFFRDVKACNKRNLLIKNYEDLKPADIPRYFMQMRYGSTYSKVKHIRVFAYFADAILFPDGALWRDS